jgi:hypothetical protein
MRATNTIGTAGLELALKSVLFGVSPLEAMRIE